MSGAGLQPMRGVPGAGFPSQQAGNRNAAVSSGRTQNGKIGSGSNWAFPMPTGGTSALSNTQTRNGGGLSSFAQTIGASHQQAPPDPSEFPSLSGVPQSQQQNTSSQAIWSNNPNLRQQMPLQRAPGQGGGTQSMAQQSQHLQQQEDGISRGQFPANADDYRFGGSGGVGQLSGAAQPQTGNIEEFPPLGGPGGAENGQDRRTSLIQSAAFTNNVNGNNFGGVGLGRNGFLGSAESQNEQSLGLGPGDRETQGAGQQGTQGSDRNLRQAPGLLGFPGLQQNQSRPQPQSEAVAEGEGLESPQSANHTDGQRVSDMSELDRFGLPGLLAMIPNESQDHSSLAVGQDLTVLGLDLSRPDNHPLYPSFGSPFADSSTRQVIPDFTLPPAYTVANVQPVEKKMQSFSDETLFAIFYQYPRDVLQEIAAQELFSRDWRWHKVLRQWMMKDTTFAQPIRLNEKQERGYYIFFDVNHWQRERREFLLHYEHLDQRHHSPLANIPT